MIQQVNIIIIQNSLSQSSSFQYSLRGRLWGRKYRYQRNLKGFQHSVYQQLKQLGDIL